MESLLRSIECNWVPKLTIVFCVISLCAILISLIVVPIYMHLRNKCSVKAYFLGMATWVVWAYVLERIAHNFIWRGEVLTIIGQNPILYCAYGGLMAAVFEEVGRWIVVKLFLKSTMANRKNPIMFGAGHGLAEAFFVLALPMVNNLIYSSFINHRQFTMLESTLSRMDYSTKLANVQGMAQLVSMPSWMFIIGLVERLFAIAAHIALSVFVWHAVRDKKAKYLWVALAFHFILDAGMSLVNVYTGNIWLVEGYIAAFAIVMCVMAYKLYKSEEKPVVAEPGEYTQAGVSDLLK